MNIGLVGCGRVAELHMCAYKRIPEVNVVAVSDINKRAREQNSRLRKPRFSNIHVMKRAMTRSIIHLSLYSSNELYLTLAQGKRSKFYVEPL